MKFTSKPGVLWVSPYMPALGFHAGGHRMFRVIERLSREFSITALCLSGPPLTRHENEQAEASLEQMGIRVIPVPFEGLFKPHLHSNKPAAFVSLAHHDMVAELEGLIGTGEFDVVQLEYSAASQWLRPSMDTPVVLTLHQLEFLASYRKALASKQIGSRFSWLYDSLKAISWEKKAVAKADAVICVCPEEARICKTAFGKKCLVAPMAADMERTSHPRTGTDLDMVFHGNFAQEANLDAAMILLNDILPGVRRRLGRASLALIGPFMPPELKRLAQRTGALVLGRVEDLGASLGRAKLYVAPLRLGGGMRGKILDALALGLPVLTTRLGAQGFRSACVTNNVQPYRAIRITDVSEMADSAAHLLRHPEDLSRMSRPASDLASTFSWEAATRVYASAYRGILQG